MVVNRVPNQDFTTRWHFCPVVLGLVFTQKRSSLRNEMVGIQQGFFTKFEVRDQSGMSRGIVKNQTSRASRSDLPNEVKSWGGLPLLSGLKLIELLRLAGSSLQVGA